jgi:hypothetical protein
MKQHAKKKIMVVIQAVSDNTKKNPGEIDISDRGACK